jgi:hypothetical protein
VTEYRYWFCDALTGQILDELPLDCQSYSQQINGVGTLTGTLALGDIPAGIDWEGATQRKRTLLVVQRNDQYVWAGRIIKRRPTDGSTKVEVTAETLEGYLARRLILDDLTYTATDVFTIVRGILIYLQGVPGGDMQLETGSNLAGQVATVTYLGDSTTRASEAIQRLAETTRLQARTEKALATTLADYTVPTVDLRPDAVPGFGDFPIGAPCRLRCTCLFHRAKVNGVPGLDVTRRITGWTVTPGDSERVSFATGQITGKITPPLKQRGVPGYLTDLDRRLRALETI